MDQLQNQINKIKDKISDQEYLNLCNSMKSLSNGQIYYHYDILVPYFTCENDVRHGRIGLSLQTVPYVINEDLGEVGDFVSPNMNDFPPIDTRTIDLAGNTIVAEVKEMVIIHKMALTVKK